MTHLRAREDEDTFTLLLCSIDMQNISSSDEASPPNCGGQTQGSMQVQPLGQAASESNSTKTDVVRPTTRVARPCTSVPLMIKEDMPQGSYSFRIWDAMTNELLWEDLNPLSKFSCYSPDINKLYFIPCQPNRLLSIFDLNTGETSSLVVGRAARTCFKIVVGRSGMRVGVVVMDEDRGTPIYTHDLEMWETHSGNKLFVVYDISVTCLCFSGNEAHIINLNNNSAVDIYDSGNGCKLRTVSHVFEDTSAGLVASLDGTMGAAYGKFGQGIRVWDIETGEIILRRQEKVGACCFGVDDTSVICFHEGQLTAWRIADNSVIFERFWFCDGGSIVFSPSSLMIYCLQRTFLNGRSTNIVVQCGALDGEEIAVSGKYSCRSMEDILLCDPPVSNILL
jgi:hypothetical protein